MDSKIEFTFCLLITNSDWYKLAVSRNVIALFCVSEHLEQIYYPTIFDDDLLPLNRVSRKKVTFHDVLLKKMKILYISLF